MSGGWDTPGGSGGGAGWETGATGGSTEWNDNAGGSSEWNGDSGVTNGFTSGDARNYVGDDGPDVTVDDAGGNDGGCRNCGQDGHFARECPEPKKGGGACFNCGEEGHNKSECTKPRVFTGKCRECDQEGHQAKDCPTKPKFCKVCKEEGHVALECTGKMKLNLNNVADKTVDEAWAMLTQASEERDLDDFKDAVKILSKASPEITYVELEQEFRKRGFSVYLIGLTKESGPTWTNVDLQGNTGKEFAIGYFFSEAYQRPTLKDKWPETPAVNLKRLANVGTPMDRGVELCNNCGELGHTKKNCPEEAMPVEQPGVSCFLCGEAGHRVRDCAQERPKPRGPRTCKVCDEEGHMAKECSKREKRTCRNCGSEDHMAKECDIIKCTNCDAEGHTWRDCTAPKDWSRVKCRNCGEMGHTIARCKEPIKEKENAPAAGGDGFVDAADGGFSDAGANDGATAGGWDDGAASGAATGGNAWESNTSAVTVSAGSGW